MYAGFKVSVSFGTIRNNTAS
ncbi:hypothetical protein [Streptococcus oralis]